MDKLVTPNLVSENLQDYLVHSEFIDWHEASVYKQATDLAKGCNDKEQIAKSCFNFVRDEIQHSGDYQRNPITCKASDVLKHGTGYCYAKSHLLAALLRANAIPTALCYQRLADHNNNTSYCLHGLNAIYLKQTGWYRIDARGNKDGVNTDFTPPEECLAYSLVISGEVDIEGFYTSPLASVIDVLMRYDNYQELSHNLPDIETV